MKKTVVNISEVIKQGYANAKRQKTYGASKRALHNRRSKAWVESLAGGFRSVYKDDPAVKVFSKGYEQNRNDFGINELLFDVTVCRVATVPSAVHKKELLYIKEPLWQVESEFARDSRQSLIDFNKLVLGSAQNKLFIGPKTRNRHAVLGVLVKPADVCKGKVFAAFLPHPSTWDKDDSEPEVYWFEGGEWVSPVI
jgi:hypothetical protein